MHVLKCCDHVHAALGNYGIVTPKLKIAYIGSIVNFYCNSKDKQVWLKDGLNIKREYVQYRSSFTLVYVTEVDSGIYTCLGTYLSGEKFCAKSKLFVGSKFLEFFQHT